MCSADISFPSGCAVFLHGWYPAGSSLASLLHCHNRGQEGSKQPLCLWTGGLNVQRSWWIDKHMIWLLGRWFDSKQKVTYWQNFSLVAWGWGLLCSLLIFLLHWGMDSASVKTACCTRQESFLCDVQQIYPSTTTNGACSRLGMDFRAGWLLCLLFLFMDVFVQSYTKMCLAPAFMLASSSLSCHPFAVQSAMPKCASLCLLDCWKSTSAVKSGSLHANNWTVLFLDFFRGGSLVEEKSSVSCGLIWVFISSPREMC